MSNIIKGSRAIDGAEGFVIDSNTRADSYFSSLVKEHEEEASKDQEGNILPLGDIVPEPAVEEEPKLTPEEIEEEARKRADEIILEAEELKKQILNQAVKEAKIKEKNLSEAAKEAGYKEGYEAAKAEFEIKFKELEDEKVRLREEFEAETERLEPLFAGLVIDYVERLTGIVAKEYETVIYNMLVSAVNNADSSRSYIIHVPKEQFEYVNSREGYIRDLVGDRVYIEIVADHVLPLNSCKIETDSCVIDAGLDTRLTTLVNSIKLLAGSKKQN